MGETAPDASRLRDRVALVTGGSSGIGRSVVTAVTGAVVGVGMRLLYALAQPAHVQIHDILMRPTAQTS